MENNKILISIHFESKDKTRVIELMILRDATLGQLLESIEYGIKKIIHNGYSKDDSVLSYEECLELFERFAKTEEYMKVLGNEKYYKNMLLSLYDRNTLEGEKSHTITIKGRELVVLFESDRKKKLCELGFVSATRLAFLDYSEEIPNIHNIETDYIVEAFNPGNQNAKIKFPQYNISARILQRYDKTPIEIIAPSDPPAKPEQNIWMMLLPSILTIGVMSLLRGTIASNAGNSSFIFMSVAMGAISLITTLLSWSRQKKQYKENLAEWKSQYETYISRVIEKIKTRQEDDAKTLDENYPSVMTLIDDVKYLEDQVFSRSPMNSDFLTVRLGKSDAVPNIFEIKGSRQEEVFSPASFEISGDQVNLVLAEKGTPGDPDFYISNLPAKISEQYRYMKNAPYLYSLSKCGALGLVSQNENKALGDINSITELFIRRMIFELCYYHSPENLQFVMFFPETANEKKINEYISRYAHLPHFHELFENKSQFVFGKKSANIVLSSMLKIMDERTGAGRDTVVTPHVVFIVFDDYNLKEHAFASYLPTMPKDGEPYRNDLGLTFIFAKKYKEYLPEFCNHIIELNPNGQCFVTAYSDKEHKTPFISDSVQRYNDESAERRSFRMLSGLYYTRISQNRQVPSSVSLFEQFEIKRKREKKVAESIEAEIEYNWGNDKDGKRLLDITKTLAVPIGKTDNGDAILDLHEKADGPHMLVAGTTGSGKSETIISYLIGLCMRFRPDEVNMMLVDMKGGGFTKRLGKLPHVVGKVTDIDGDENNTGSEYMLKRFLVAVKSEVKRRKLVINHFDNVDSIDGYIKKCRELKATADASKEDLEYISENPLTHLLLVIDEFTELKRFSNENSSVDYMGEITTIARIGRSLGIHIILISQNIEGAITDDIRVNSKSRLCLKVATRQASKEMIGNDLAASPSMPGNGRAYLLVGTGSKFEYFQSAYSGVLASEDTSSDLIVTHVHKEGEYSQFYCSYEDNKKLIDARKNDATNTQLKETVDTICAIYEKKLRNSEISAVRDIFRDPLPVNVVYDAKKFLS